MTIVTNIAIIIMVVAILGFISKAICFARVVGSVDLFHEVLGISLVGLSRGMSNIKHLDC